MHQYAATIGLFDGVHTGHQFLISQLTDEAKRYGLEAAILTFEQSPKAEIRGEKTPMLNTLQERVERLKNTGVDEIFCFQFPVIRHFTAAEFLHILHDQCGVEVLIMGYDHRFGSDQLSRWEDYQQAATKAGIRLVKGLATPATTADCIPSSSAIRKALSEGDIATANQLLGYAYSLSGIVIHGREIGRTIGFPTANLQVDSDKIIPCDGVYIVEAIGENLNRKGLVNIGQNPTVNTDENHTEKHIELHIPGFDGDLYQQPITIRFIRRIRDEKAFDNLEQLKAQIQNDLKELEA